MRQACHHRRTAETDVSVQLQISQAPAQSTIETGVPFFDHLLAQFSRHGRFGLELRAVGDLAIDGHHTVEDTGIVLGLAFREALGDRRGILRYASMRLPMDETLVVADVDLTTRSYLHYDIRPGREFVGDFDTSLGVEFWRAFVHNCGLNLHLEQIRGSNAHHILEASFKAAGIAIGQACRIDPGGADGVPSTKGSL